MGTQSPHTPLSLVQPACLYPAFRSPEAWFCTCFSTPSVTYACPCSMNRSHSQHTSFISHPNNPVSAAYSSNNRVHCCTAVIHTCAQALPVNNSCTTTAECPAAPRCASSTYGSSLGSRSILSELALQPLNAHAENHDLLQFKRGNCCVDQPASTNNVSHAQVNAGPASPTPLSTTTTARCNPQSNCYTLQHTPDSTDNSQNPGVASL
jgi:hypothetical protein